MTNEQLLKWNDMITERRLEIAHRIEVLTSIIGGAAVPFVSAQQQQWALVEMLERAAASLADSLLEDGPF